jgi:hypothetical protein
MTYILLIVGDPQGILDQQFRPHPIHLLKMIIILITYNKLLNFKKWGPFQLELEMKPK